MGKQESTMTHWEGALCCTERIMWTSCEARPLSIQYGIAIFGSTFTMNDSRQLKHEATQWQL